MTPLRIELLHVPNCPNVNHARGLLQDCLRELRLNVDIIDKEGAFPSPTILVNGIDVMGSPAVENAACRLDIPTRACIIAALHRA